MVFVIGGTVRIDGQEWRSPYDGVPAQNGDRVILFLRRAPQRTDLYRAAYGAEGLVVLPSADQERLTGLDRREANLREPKGPNVRADEVLSLLRSFR